MRISYTNTTNEGKHSSPRLFLIHVAYTNPNTIPRQTTSRQLLKEITNFIKSLNKFQERVLQTISFTEITVGFLTCLSMKEGIRESYGWFSDFFFLFPRKKTAIKSKAHARWERLRNRERKIVWRMLKWASKVKLQQNPSNRLRLVSFWEESRFQPQLFPHYSNGKMMTEISFGFCRAIFWARTLVSRDQHFKKFLNPTPFLFPIIWIHVKNGFVLISKCLILRFLN